MLYSSEEPPETLVCYTFRVEANSIDKINGVSGRLGAGTFLACFWPVWGQGKD